MKDTFKTKYGLVLIAAGSAIGLGNVWRFPYIVGKYGGAIFVLIYLLFLVLMGIPLLNVELAVGRASKVSPKESFSVLGKSRKWDKLGWISFVGPYILMFFYTVVSGWIIYYVYKFINGTIFDAANYGEFLGSLLSNPGIMVLNTIITIVLSFGVVAIGFNKGVESITSKMMLLLFMAIILLVANSLFLPNAAEGLKFYLVPNFETVKEVGILRVCYEAMNQAFFTLSIGVGAIATFGAKSTNASTTMNSAIQIVILDTFVAFMSGLIIFPATTAFSIDQKVGPGLVFIVIPEVFKNMDNGLIWGLLFFIFLAFAALSTVIATFEEIVENFIGLFKTTRLKSIIINLFVVLIGSLPVTFGFNIWGHIQPFGEGSVILDLYDFILSANLLPLGALGYLMFVLSKSGWGYEKFIDEVNTGKGLKIKFNIKPYLTFVVPLLVISLYVTGYVLKFLS